MWLVTSIIVWLDMLFLFRKKLCSILASMLYFDYTRSNMKLVVVHMNLIIGCDSRCWIWDYQENFILIDLLLQDMSDKSSWALVKGNLLFADWWFNDFEVKARAKKSPSNKRMLLTDDNVGCDLSHTLGIHLQNIGNLQKQIFTSQMTN